MRFLPDLAPTARRSDSSAAVSAKFVMVSVTSSMIHTTRGRSRSGHSHRATLVNMTIRTPRSDSASDPHLHAPGGDASKTLDIVPITLRDGASAPVRAHTDDAGLDLASTVDLTIGPGERATVPTGICIALPAGTVGLVCPRSGLASAQGVTVLNGPGIVDAGYRGEIKVVLHNTDAQRTCTIKRGDRIAQLVVMPYLPLVPQVVENLESTDRSDRGFGSSGSAQIPVTERNA